jgi:DNA-binding transcriptional ArsR family regulator
VQQADLFETLADPTRRQIVELLLEGEKAVSELVCRTSIRQSGVSRHLRILDEAGFVSARAEGTRRIYSLRPEPFSELASWVHRFNALWEARLDRFGQALAARQNYRSTKRHKGESS